MRDETITLELLGARVLALTADMRDLQQRVGTLQIMSLAWREHQFGGIAERIDEGVNLGRQAAAGSADRLRAVFFRAPALCW